ncbi:uncharacterized protein LOC125829036 [Solanum verrucosum]|uniref:uncharacterized protein LOC125829036 n=1 Tax=Solanum verrucosum TaxID=315347 RepID=UPI0020D0F117|nr:uncharacterized protein LOC125829036 [Solanum verrucosum]
MSLFVVGLSPLSSKKGKAAMLIGDIDIGRLMVYVQHVEEKKLRDREGFRNKKATTGNANKGEYNSENSQPSIVRPAQSQGIVAEGGNWAPACVKCGRTYRGKCRDGSTCCFKCGQEGDFMKYFPKNRQSNVNQGNRVQSSSVAPLDRATPRGATSIASQGQRQEGPVAGIGGEDRVASTRIRDFFNLDPTSFTASDPNEDPQDFIDQVQ